MNWETTSRVSATLFEKSDVHLVRSGFSIRIRILMPRLTHIGALEYSSAIIEHNARRTERRRRKYEEEIGRG